jgi:hypothetical protein
MTQRKSEAPISGLDACVADEESEDRREGVVAGEVSRELDFELCMDGWVG